MARRVHPQPVDRAFRHAVHDLHRAGPDLLVRLLVDLQRAHPSSSGSVADLVIGAAAYPAEFLAAAAQIVRPRDVIRIVRSDADG